MDGQIHGQNQRYKKNNKKKSLGKCVSDALGQRIFFSPLLFSIRLAWCKQGLRGSERVRPRKSFCAHLGPSYKANTPSQTHLQSPSGKKRVKQK